MSIYNSMAAVSAINVLSDSVVANMEYFTFEGHTFSPIYLAGLAQEIKYDYLHVEKDSTKDGSSGYDAYTNTIYLNFSMPANTAQRAMIVHEATHAMFDFQGRKMDIATSESLSYIAQCMYGRLSGAFDLSDPDSRLGVWVKKDGEWVESIRDKVFKTGWRIAEKLIGGGSIDGTDVSDMRNAISLHPYYDSTHSKKANYNGY